MLKNEKSRGTRRASKVEAGILGERAQMQLVLIILYVALGLAQISAFLAGIHLWLGVGAFFGLVIFFGTSFLPFGSIIDSGIAFYGAYRAWDWPWWQAALLTFPFAIVGVGLIGAEGVVKIAATLKPRRTNFTSAPTPPAAPLPQESRNSMKSSPRIGRRGICIVCGSIKSGSFVPCEECGFQPNSEQDLTIATMLNEASVRNFDQLALDIRSGHRPIIRPEDVESRIASGREARRMLGPISSQVQSRIITEGMLQSATAFMLGGIDKTINMITPERISALSREAIVAIIGISTRNSLIEIAPKSEKQFIRKIFAKRIMIECINCKREFLSDQNRQEFATIMYQSFLEIDSKDINLSVEKIALEKQILPFVFRDKSGLLEYTVRFADYPHIAGYVKVTSAAIAKALQELSAKRNW